MGLKPCKECGADVSTSAKSCPHCGVKDPARAKQHGCGTGCLFLLAALVVLVVIASLMDSGTSYTPPTSGSQTTSVTSSSPTEAKLVAIDQGVPVVPTSEVRYYGTLLDKLNSKCPENRTFIGDIAVRGTQLLKSDKGVTLSVKKFLEAMDGAIPPEAANVVKCTEISAALVVMIGGG